MKFKMNGMEWTIEQASADDIKKVFKDDKQDSYYFGSITMSEQKILINKEVSLERQKIALCHELMHCYLYCYILSDLQFDEEGICDISSKSHDIIHKIVEDYFNRK